MISINKWFSKNAKYPLFLLGIGTIVVQICFIVYIFASQAKDQEKSVQNLVTVANLALEQKNRPVLESIFDVAIEELGAKYIVLCHDQETVITLPFGKFNCSNLPKSDFFTKHQLIEAVGRPDYQFHFYLPIFRLSPSYIALFAITLMFFFISLGIILKVQRRFCKDILGPLENNLLSDNEINIIQLEQLRTKIKEMGHNKEKEAAASAILEHKAKVAHNIRSLVQTLKSLQSSVEEHLTPVRKALFKDVVDGIGNILTEFSTKSSVIPGKKLFPTDEAFFENLKAINEKRSKIEVAETVKSVVQQKSYELQSVDPDVLITCQIDDSVNYRFIDVDETEFRSILSNVINNAFESCQSSTPKVDVTVKVVDDFVEVRIIDNATGIPEEIKESLFDRGITAGKSEGTGYGLFHASSFLSSWNGDITVESTSENGTTFLIKIPCWMPTPIKLDDGDTIVVLDDDPFVHEIWKNKINKFEEGSGKKVKMNFFFDFPSLNGWMSQYKVDFSCTSFFIDNDLGESLKPGSEIIDELGISEISTLITNRYDDRKLNQYCLENAIYMLPKPLFISNDQMFFT